MSGRYEEYVARLRKAVLEGSAETPAAWRQAAEARAAFLGGRTPSAGAAEMPAELQRFVDKIARQAVTITDADVLGLRQAGYSEDAIFEITASAALGAGLGRLERGMAALKGQI